MVKHEACKSLADLLEANSDVVSGCVVLKGPRLPVDGLFVDLAAGPLEEICGDFPSIGRDRAAAVIWLAGPNFVARFAK